MYLNTLWLLLQNPWRIFCCQWNYCNVNLGWMDGWMICNFMSFSTVFQSYQDDGQMRMKGCEQWNPVYGWEDFTSSGAKTRGHYSGVAYVIPWPLFVNQECYIPKCLTRRAVFENSSCEFFQSLFKVKAKGQRSVLKNKGDKFIIHYLWWA